VVLFTPNAFDHFGVTAAIGRAWSPKDIPQPGAPPPLAVLSRSFQKYANVFLGRYLIFTEKYRAW
jgi:hypothetical protein